MTAIKDSLWKTFKMEADKAIKENSNLKFKDNAENIFKNKFQEIYDDVLNNKMGSGTHNLDGHKQAAIGAISFAITAPLDYNGEIPDEKYLSININLGLSVSLACMLDYLNCRLSKNNLPKIETPYELPISINCRSNFFSTLRDAMYFNCEEDIISKTALNWANTFYLIEYTNLQAHNVDINKIKD